jgi:hypothetical protein
MDNASKYIVLYNGVPYPVNSIEEAANNLFGLRVEISENGRDWDIIVNGESRAHYIRAGIDDNIGISSRDNGYTKEEALRDYMRNFVGKNTYYNLHWYQLMDNSE